MPRTRRFALADSLHVPGGDVEMVGFMMHAKHNVNHIELELHVK